MLLTIIKLFIVRNQAFAALAVAIYTGYPLIQGNRSKYTSLLSVGQIHNVMN
jgi:hypothetical protein